MSKLTLRPLRKRPATSEASAAAAPRPQAPAEAAVAAAAPQPAPVAGPSRQEIEDDLCELLAQVLFIDKSGLRRDRPFNELGLDSILGVEFMQAINAKYGFKLKATMLYEHSNIQSLAELVMAQRPASAAAPAKSAAEPPRPADALDALLAGVESGSISVDAATAQLAHGAAQPPQRTESPEREALFAVVKRNLLMILPHVPPAEVQMGRSMTELGANSLDRADVVIATLEELNLKIPQERLAQARDLSGLVDILHEFARPKPGGA